MMQKAGNVQADRWDDTVQGVMSDLQEGEGPNSGVQALFPHSEGVSSQTQAATERSPAESHSTYKECVSKESCTSWKTRFQNKMKNSSRISALTLVSGPSDCAANQSECIRGSPE